MSEEDIQEELQKIYTSDVEVKWRDFRIYDVYLKIKLNNDLLMISVAIIYDAMSTPEANIYNIEQKIDRELIKLFKRNGEEDD